MEKEKQTFDSAKRVHSAWKSLCKLEEQDRHVEGCGCVYCEMGIALENLYQEIADLEAEIERKDERINSVLNDLYTHGIAIDIDKAIRYLENALKDGE